VTPNKRKHFGESWVVEANRERDRQHQIESRERHEEFLEEFRNLSISDGHWWPEVPSREEVGMD
jgi:hypothetical protein